MEGSGAQHCEEPRWHLRKLLFAQVLGDHKASSNRAFLGIKSPVPIPKRKPGCSCKKNNKIERTTKLSLAGKVVKAG